MDLSIYLLLLYSNFCLKYMRDIPLFLVIELCGTDDISMCWGKGLRKSEAIF